jgi:hypothetical protein
MAGSSIPRARTCTSSRTIKHHKFGLPVDWSERDLLRLFSPGQDLSEEE